jgi:pimeloyl-ACP methyl ester carboxylesterase
LWHFTFNRLVDLNEQLVEGREQLFFGWQFENKAATPLPAPAIEVYVKAIAASPEALHASFGPYRELDLTIEQNERRRHHRLSMPVLTLAGARSTGELVADTIGPVADRVHAHLVLSDCGHFLAEEAPREVLAALFDFLIT